MIITFAAALLCCAVKQYQIESADLRSSKTLESLCQSISRHVTDNFGICYCLVLQSITILHYVCELKKDVGCTRIFRLFLMTAFAAVQFRCPFFLDVVPPHWVNGAGRFETVWSICILRPLRPPQYRKQRSAVTHCHGATCHENGDIAISDCLEADVCTVLLNSLTFSLKCQQYSCLFPKLPRAFMFLNLGHCVAASSNTVANFRLLQEAENFQNTRSCVSFLSKTHITITIVITIIIVCHPEALYNSHCTSVQ